MPYVLKDGQQISINLEASQEIGAGGMGIVYRIGNIFGTGNLVAKIFKTPNDPKNPSLSKLQTMIDRPPQHVYEAINGVGYTQFAWVQYLITNNEGQLIGYAMPELDFDHSLSLNPFMYPREASKLSPFQQSLNYRVQLCANISALMADLHRHGHAFIDFKEQNLRLMPEAKTGIDDDYKGFIVGFIDCDSYRITRGDGKVFPCPVISPEMTSPEYHEHKDISLLDERHDRFVLAIELFKILNNGIHPFYFIPLSERLKNLANRNTDQFIKERLYAYGLEANPEIAPLKNSIHLCWDDVTRAMFDKAFLSLNPADRPSAEAWENHFRNLSRQRQFVTCENYPNDASHIHFLGKPCHRCMFLQVTNSPAQLSAQTISPTNQVPQDSVWRSAPSQAATIHPTTNSSIIQTPKTNLADNNTNDVDSLEQNRRLEQSLNANRMPPIYSPPNQAAPVENPQKTAQSSDDTNEINTASPIAMTEPESTALDSMDTKDTNTHVQKKPNRWWLVPLIIGVVGVGGYSISKLSPSSLTATHGQNRGNDSSKSNNATTTTKSSNKDGVDENPNSYAAIIKSLPTAKQTITQELNAINEQGGLFKRLTQNSGAKLYETTLGISPEFFNEVVKVANTGEPTLTQLQETAYSQAIETTQTQSLQSFRDADMSFFAKQPVNRNLAKQFNEAAKNYFWNKKDPKAAVYLQAQAVKNSPNQGEYVANLAYYLFKNNYPFTKQFLLYALQTPRDASKYPNTYMIELSSALAVKEGNEKSAIGALLAQFYTSDEKEKRCQNMLRYPQTYPELIPIAEKVLTIIDKQNSEGINPAPEICLPPYQWVN